MDSLAGVAGPDLVGGHTHAGSVELGWARQHAMAPLLGNWGYFLLLVLAFLSQIYRYRRVSGPIQRQQTKWVITAAIMMPFSDLVIRGILNAVLPFANHPGPGRVIHYMITIPLFRTLPFMLVPIAFAFAIFRYRLWDIDILICRTLQYSLLTTLLGVLYISSILLLQAVFSSLGRQPSALTTVISTLLIAALFTPLRRRVQNFIDTTIIIGVITMPSRLWPNSLHCPQRNGSGGPDQ